MCASLKHEACFYACFVDLLLVHKNWNHPSAHVSHLSRFAGGGAGTYPSYHQSITEKNNQSHNIGSLT